MFNLFKKKTDPAPVSEPVIPRFPYLTTITFHDGETWTTPTAMEWTVQEADSYAVSFFRDGMSYAKFETSDTGLKRRIAQKIIPARFIKYVSIYRADLPDMLEDM